ncbi:MAG: hypothetical protein QW597_02485 [Thermoplasmataceae archaeon]
MKIYSERFPIKYLLSNEGVCLGVDTKKRSFLLIISRRGAMFRERPAGDTVVEDLNYGINEIFEAIFASAPQERGDP